MTVRAEGDGAPVLAVEGLRVSFAGASTVHAVRGVGFNVAFGECLAILGESGSGKSVTAQALLGIVPSPPGRVSAERLELNGRDLRALSEREMRWIRGREIALVFQDALASLNPRFTVGYQVGEVLRVHLGMSRRAANARIVELFESVGIPSAAERLRAYPHQFSGGMRQRVMIAMAIALDPVLLIADEPTTALDVTMQAQVLDLLKQRQRSTGMSMILITHDISVARAVADRLAVLYAGRMVEEGPIEAVMARPAHPYTAGLLRSGARTEPKGVPLRPIPGSPPDPGRLPPGCPFHPRCEHAIARCHDELPPMAVHAVGRLAACHLADRMLGDA